MYESSYWRWQELLYVWKMDNLLMNLTLKVWKVFYFKTLSIAFVILNNFCLRTIKLSIDIIVDWDTPQSQTNCLMQSIINSVLSLLSKCHFASRKTIFSPGIQKKFINVYAEISTKQSRYVNLVRSCCTGSTSCARQEFDERTRPGAKLSLPTFPRPKQTKLNRKHKSHRTGVNFFQKVAF